MKEGYDPADVARRASMAMAAYERELAGVYAIPDDDPWEEDMKFHRLCLVQDAGTCTLCEKPITPGQGYLSPTGGFGTVNLAHEECVEKYSKETRAPALAGVGGHHEIID